MLSYLYDIFIYPIELIIELIYSFANRMLHSPGLAIIAVSLVVNILVLPLYNKSDAMQEEERNRQAAMKKWTDHIKKTFKGNERFMMQSAYYRQMNYKPIYALRGSFSLLLQIPFFMAAYHFLSNLSQLQGTSFLFLKDLGQPDGLLKIGKLSVNLLPITMTAINIISGAIYTKGSPVKEKIQLYGIALIFLVLLYASPAGLVFYWTLNNLFSLFKNIFTKVVPNPKKVLAICLAVIGVVVFGYLMTARYNGSMLRLAIYFCMLIVLELPLIMRLIRKRKASRDDASRREICQPDKGLFIISSLFLTILLGAVITSAVLSSSPSEFMTAGSPFALMGHTLCIFAGFFLVWVSVFYFLADKKARVIITAILFCLCLIFTANFMLVGKNLGVMSSLFKFVESPSFSRVEKLMSLGLSLVLLIGGVLLALKAPKVAKYASIVLLIGAISLAGINSVTMANRLKDIRASEASEQEDVCDIHLSKDGQNVIVLMLDRSISGFVPYMMEEKPELKEQFAGFTYYPNTISYGSSTNFGAPPLFGGYDYTPTAINARKDESLRDKHDEALSVMPTVFAQQGYSVSLYNPPHAGYQSIPDLSVFEGIPNTKAFNTRGRFEQYYPKNYVRDFSNVQKRNLTLYSLFKVLPYPAQTLLYDGGMYYRPADSMLLSDEFVESYSVLEALPSITVVEESAGSSFIMLENDATHAPSFLQEPDYNPVINYTSHPFDNSEKINLTGERVDLKQEPQLMHYHVDMAAFLKLGEWFDYLREQGVYDNTRIILASDHGRDLDIFNYCELNGTRSCMDGYCALLMVKDFGSSEYQVSNEFMSNADVPWLAMDQLIENPVNPFTGNPINDSPKSQPQLITTSGIYEVVGNDRNTFDTSDGYWITVHDNIFEEENWSIVKAGEN